MPAARESRPHRDSAAPPPAKVLLGEELVAGEKTLGGSARGGAVRGGGWRPPRGVAEALWMASATNLMKVLDIYFGCFISSAAQAGTA